MKRSIAILLGLAFLAGAGLAYAGKGGGGGRSGGGFHSSGRAFASAGISTRPAPSGGFTRFTTGPMRFTTGPQPRPVVGVRPPGVIGRPVPIPPPPANFHRSPVIVGGGTIVVTAPWYPAYPYPYPYPYVAPVTGGPAYAELPTYSDSPAYSDAPANSDVPGYTERNDYWYFCPDSQAYYPYVQTCPSPWVQVLPEPGPAPN
jgi:hypothetical protein